MQIRFGSRFTSLAAVLVLTAALAGCGSASSNAAATGDDDDDSSPTPTPSAYTLSSGTYQYVVDEVPADSCWAPPKTYPEIPQTVVAEVTVDGDTITVSTDPGNTGTPQVFTITRNGNDLTGAASGSWDLASYGIDCVLGIGGTFQGTLIADDTFDTTQVVDVTQQSGAFCSLLIGSTQPQLDALPCQVTFQGTASLQ